MPSRPILPTLDRVRDEGGEHEPKATKGAAITSSSWQNGERRMEKAEELSCVLHGETGGLVNLHENDIFGLSIE